MAVSQIDDQTSANGPERLAEVRSLDLLPRADSSPALQAIAEAAALLCDAPIALVAPLSQTQAHLMAQVGLDGVALTGRQSLFCLESIKHDGVFEVVDARQDDRFRANPLVVSDPHIRRYAGAALRAPSGHCLGTLCVMGHRPRRLSKMQREVLGSLAQAAVACLEGERRVLEERAWSQQMLGSVADCIISTDAGGFVDYVNPAAAEVLGRSPREMLSLPIEKLLELTRFGEMVSNPVIAAMATGRAALTPNGATLAVKGGAPLAIEYRAAPVRNVQSEIVGAVMAFRDVTADREAEMKLDFYGTRDPLTGVFNRFAIESAIVERLRQVKQSGHVKGGGALLLVDLDRFKGVNDELGYAAGDRLLRHVATAMAACVERVGLFARIGGDEFAVLLQPMEPEQVEEIAERLSESLVDLRHSFTDIRVKMGASVGMVMLDEVGLTLAESLRRADLSCYAAKNAGGDQARWYDKRADDIENRSCSLRWMNTIEQALHRNEISLFGQHITPIDAASSSSIEVLVRHESSGELTTAGAFMPAVERFLLGRKLDEWVLRNTLSLLQRDPTRLDNIDAVHINLSAQTFGDAAMVDPFVSMVLNSGLPPSKLCFEITETGAVADIGNALKFIAGLKQIGCRFALDDFGRGFASLEYLKRLPVDIVKIDGMFLFDMRDDAVSRQMVTAIQEVCDLLGVQTIAESVEDPALMPELEALGVHSIQGFCDHRPEPLNLALAALER